MSLDIIFLGTSSAIPTTSRWLPSIAIIRRGKVFLMDCGEGTQIRMLRMGISPLKVDTIMITHSHGDHFFGLLGLLQTMNILSRRDPLQIVASSKIIEFVETGLELTESIMGFELNFYETVEGFKLRRNDVTIEAFKVEHTDDSFGYIIREDDVWGEFIPEKALSLGVPMGPLWKKLQRGEEIVLEDGRIVTSSMVTKGIKRGLKIVYTGDTRPSENTIRAARGADILIHDSTFTSDRLERAMETLHSTAREAALIARAANVKLLILTHISARYTSPVSLLRDSVEVFKPVVVACDLLRVNVRRVDKNSILWRLDLP